MSILQRIRLAFDAYYTFLTIEEMNDDVHRKYVTRVHKAFMNRWNTNATVEFDGLRLQTIEERNKSSVKLWLKMHSRN